MKNLKILIVAAFTSLVFIQCSDFLDVKPSAKIAIPETGDDLMAILSGVNDNNYNFAAGLGEIGSDNVFVIPAVWQAILIEEWRNSYTWSGFVSDTYWDGGYRKVSRANIVLENASHVRFKNQAQREEVLGMAHFFRGHAYFDLAQVFSRPYTNETEDDYGIVLRKSADVNVKSVRSTIRETYDQIIFDLKFSAQTLPPSKPLYPTRPYRASAYGALARVYLAINDYENAKLYADSCLNFESDLMDYNMITNKPYPFQKFNPEAFFYTQISGSGILTEATARVDPDLVALYEEGDQRKRLFFSQKADGYHSFVGDYGAQSGALKFSGLTTAELILIQAECLVRTGHLDEAKRSIQKLIDNRYEKTLTPNISGYDASVFLKFVLAERRKELVFRGLRWSDLRRLSVEELGKSQWVRKLNSEEYIMTKDRMKKFAFKIPQDVIDITQMPQNLDQ